MNIWFWLFFIVLPLLVLSAKPESTVWWRWGRLLLAIGAGYYFLYKGAAALEEIEVQTLDAFYKQFPNCIDHQCENRPNGYRFSGFSMQMEFAGWLVASVYVGFFETIWYSWHAKKIRSLGNQFRHGAISIFVHTMFLLLLILIFILAIGYSPSMLD